MTSTDTDVEVPTIDKRPHKFIELPNGVKGILVSDPSTTVGAAALAVHAGQLNDPSNVQGLAHFLEHMVFLGTEDFPKESEFDKFCSEAAGYANAYTSHEETCFHFRVNAAQLPEGVRRLASFFVCPLLTESSSEREMKAVDSENTGNLQHDAHREYQLIRSSAKEGHPWQMFGTGNYYTLHDLTAEQGVNVREALLAFHHKHYVARNICVSIIGNQSIQELEELFVSSCSKIPDRVPERLGQLSDPFEGQWKSVFHIVPVQDTPKLTVYWPTPSTKGEWEQKTYRILSYCLGHEGEGSILAALKAGGLAHDLCAGVFYTTSHFSIFACDITLTNEGLDKWQAICALVYEYIQKLKQSSFDTRQRIYDEIRAMEIANFNFKSKEREDKYVEHLANNLHDYPPSKAVNGQSGIYCSELDGAKLNGWLDCLTWDNCRIHRVSAADKFPEGVTADLTERWYQTQYAVQDIATVKNSSKLIPELASLLHLPEENPYIPKDLSLVAEHVKEKPSKVFARGRAAGFHAVDTSFGEPRASLLLNLSANFVDETAKSAICNRIFLTMLEESINKESYMAEEAGLILDITNNDDKIIVSGIRAEIKGYSDKLPRLAAAFANAVQEMPIDETLFEFVKQILDQDYAERRFEHPYQRSTKFARSMLEFPSFTDEARHEVLKGVTVQDMIDYKTRMMEELHLTGVLVGNISKQSAISLFENLSNTFQVSDKSVNLAPSLTVASKLHQHIDTVLWNEQEKNSAVSMYFGLGAYSVRKSVLAELCMQIMAQHLFEVLRTKEQLGYIVQGFTSWRWLFGHIVILVQSAHPPPFVKERIESALGEFLDAFPKQDEQDFFTAAKSLQQKLRQPFLNVKALCKEYAVGAMTGHNNWNRLEQEADECDKISKDDMVEFMTQVFKSENTPRVCSIAWSKEEAEKASLGINPGQLAIVQPAVACKPANQEKITKDFEAAKAAIVKEGVPELFDSSHNFQSIFE